MDAIIKGVDKFKREVFPGRKKLYEKLGQGQSPAALVISCADSRVDLQTVTQSDPGQLFFFRNAGNIVPPHGATPDGVTGTLEYAMVALEIPNIIVCGHSDCGAMKGILNPSAVTSMPSVAKWLQFSDAARDIVTADDGIAEDERLPRLIEQNVLAQLRNLQTLPYVAARLARGSLKLHGWVYDIPGGRIDAYDAQRGTFVPLDSDPMPDATPRSAAQ